MKLTEERLHELAKGDMDIWYSESQSMAKELLALRKAFSEPVCCIEPPELDYLSSGDDARVYWPKAAELGDILLYRKP